MLGLYVSWLGTGYHIIIVSTQLKFQSLLVHSSSESVTETNTNQLDPQPETFVPLSKEVTDGVQKFVLFAGYPGSGHSIIGSMMDAHPNMIISHEFTVLKKLLSKPEINDKLALFNALYKDSYNDVVKGWRSATNSKKGYSLGTGGTWQAKFSELKVIGDKSGGQTTRYFYEHPADFNKAFHKLQKIVGVPLVVVHVVRNPYDMAATETLYRESDQYHGVKLENASQANPYNDPFKLMNHIKLLSKRAKAMVHMTEKYDMNILEIHNSEFVLEPVATLQKICLHLELECPEDYLRECEEKQKDFRRVSKTRHSVVWTPEALAMVKELTLVYPFFQGYSFESN